MAAAAGAAALVGALAPAAAQADVAGCPVFPATSAWNERVDQLPAAANSAALIARMAPRTGLVPGFARQSTRGSRGSASPTRWSGRAPRG